ncbi:hypothetical protein HPC50_15435, partial [Corallococcus exiguus]|nr:hypothetical protein [Corallococcus exiguus]
MSRIGESIGGAIAARVQQALTPQVRPTPPPPAAPVASRPSDTFESAPATRRGGPAL